MAGLSMHFRVGVVAVVAWTTLSLIGASDLFAQAATTRQLVPHNKPNQALRTARGMVTKAIREDAYPNPEDPKIFEEYFTNFIFPQFLEPENVQNLSRLPQLRRELRTVYFGPGKAGRIHNELCSLTLDWMKEVIKGQWPIMYKYNAMLVIGELNQKELDGKNEPVPYPMALTVMLMAVNSKAFDTQDYLRFAAMVGIERHAESHNYSPLGGQAVSDIVAAMLPIAQQATPPIKRSIDGHNWYRRSAIQILGALGNTGTNGQVVTTLEAVATDPKTVLPLRCAAAEALGRVKYGGMKVDYVRLAKEIGQVVCDISKYQVAEFDKDPNYELKRVVRGYLGPIHEAVASPTRTSLNSSCSGSPQQAAVTAITSKIDDLCKACDSDKNDGKLLRDALEAKVAVLEKLINSAPAGAPAAAPVAAGGPAPAPPRAPAPGPATATGPAPAAGAATARPSAPLAAGAPSAPTSPQN